MRLTPLPVSLLCRVCLLQAAGGSSAEAGGVSSQVDPATLEMKQRGFEEQYEASRRVRVGARAGARAGPMLSLRLKLGLGLRLM